MTITPALATKWLKITADSEVRHRNPSPKRVSYWAEEIQKGRWKDGGGGPMIVGPKGEVIDGMHRLRAVIEAGKPIRSFVIRLHRLGDAAAALKEK